MKRREAKWALERFVGGTNLDDWRDGPRTRTVHECWDVERASAWLRQFDFGEKLIQQLEADPEPERIHHFLMMVSRVHEAVNGYAIYFGPNEVPRILEDDELDVAMWPALIAGLYE